MSRGVAIAGAVLAILAMAGCAVEVKNKWQRIDGQSVETNPALVKQFEIDKTICEGEMQKANLAGSSYCRGLADCVVTGAARGSAMAIVGKGCMAQRGYLLAPDTSDDASAEPSQGG